MFKLFNIKKIKSDKIGVFELIFIISSYKYFIILITFISFIFSLFYVQNNYDTDHFSLGIPIKENKKVLLQTSLIETASMSLFINILNLQSSIRVIERDLYMQDNVISPGGANFNEQYFPEIYRQKGAEFSSYLSLDFYDYFYKNLTDISFVEKLYANLENSNFKHLIANNEIKEKIKVIISQIEVSVEKEDIKKNIYLKIRSNNKINVNDVDLFLNYLIDLSLYDILEGLENVSNIIDNFLLNSIELQKNFKSTKLELLNKMLSKSRFYSDDEIDNKYNKYYFEKVPFISEELLEKEINFIKSQEIKSDLGNLIFNNMKVLKNNINLSLQNEGYLNDKFSFLIISYEDQKRISFLKNKINLSLLIILISFIFVCLLSISINLYYTEKLKYNANE